MRIIGDKVRLSVGGYGDLNYNNLVEHEWIPNMYVEIIKINTDNKYPYTISLPDSSTLDICERDIK